MENLNGTDIKKLFTILVFFSYCVVGFSQVEGPCAQKLAEANDEFEEGHFYTISGLLKSCIRRGFSKEQRIQAHYLLTRTYLYLDKPDSAEYHYLELLKENPEYRVDEENDPIDIVYLSEKFTTSPIISISAEGGTNLTMISILNDYDATDGPENFGAGWAFQLAAGLEVHFSDAFSFKFNPTFLNRRWKFEGVYYESDPSYSNSSNNTLTLPFTFKYTIDKITYRPYIYTGYSQNVLFFSNQKLSGHNQEGDTQTQNTSPSIFDLSVRSIFTGNLIVGLGLQYKVGHNFIHADLQYSYGLNTINDPNNRYPEKNGHTGFVPTNQFSIVDDDFKGNTVLLNIGITKPLYKPRRKDKFTLRTLFDEISTKLLKSDE